MEKHTINDLAKKLKINKATALYKAHVLTLLLVCASVVGIGTAGIIEFSNKGASQEAQYRGHFVETTIAVLLVAFIAVVMVETGKKIDRTAARTALKYLKQLFGKKPELKQFENVLSDQKSLEEIAAYIFNNLRPSEQQDIHKIIEDSHLLGSLLKLESLSGAEKTKQIMDIENLKNAIIEKIENHATVHPEFMPGLESLLLGLSYNLDRQEVINMNRNASKQAQQGE